MNKTSRSARRVTAALGVAAMATGTLAVLSAPSALAAPLNPPRVVLDTDWTTAAVGGIGSVANGGGSGTIDLTGVRGDVTGAYLAWHGIGDDYDNPDITMNAHAVSGTPQGLSGSNCWGRTSSQTFVADVSSIVQPTGNGQYELAGLGDFGDAEGAVLVVTYDDSDTTNDRDLYLAFGNDSNIDENLGDPGGWDDTVPGVAYHGGNANLTLAVADGQNAGPGDDGDLLVTAAGRQHAIYEADDPHGLWDSRSGVPDAGHSRSGADSLFDVASFDVTPVMGRVGTRDLTVSAQQQGDCLGLVMAAVDVTSEGPVTVSVSPSTVTEGTAPLASGRKTTLARSYVVLSNRRARDTTLVMHVNPGTATRSSDYRTKIETVTIPAGRLRSSFPVGVVPDSRPEPNEDYSVLIDSASVRVGTGEAIGTIIDDDSPTVQPSSLSLTAPGLSGGDR